MPTLADKDTIKAVKLLIAADSGSGKTGGLASLVNELGLELFILDYDNGLDPLFSFVKPDKRHLVHYVTLQDKIGLGPKGPFTVKVDSFGRGLSMLNNWVDGAQSFGGIHSWGPDRVLVFDSLTMMGNAAMRAEISMRGKTDLKPRSEKGYADPREIIGDAANDLEGLFAAIYDDKIRCHVVLLSHIRELGTKDNPINFPSAVGATLPKVLGRYFNTLIGMKKIGTNRVFTTEDAILTTKCPVKLPLTLPISNGLATIFKAILSAGNVEGKEPAAATAIQEEPKAS